MFHECRRIYLLFLHLVSDCFVNNLTFKKYILSLGNIYLFNTANVFQKKSYGGIKYIFKSQIVFETIGIQKKKKKNFAVLNQEPVSQKNFSGTLYALA